MTWDKGEGMKRWMNEQQGELNHEGQELQCMKEMDLRGKKVKLE